MIAYKLIKQKVVIMSSFIVMFDKFHKDEAWKPVIMEHILKRKERIRMIQSIPNHEINGSEWVNTKYNQVACISPSLTKKGKFRITFIRDSMLESHLEGLDKIQAIDELLTMGNWIYQRHAFNKALLGILYA